jgi:preprotein translocase subunit SecD
MVTKIILLLISIPFLTNCSNKNSQNNFKIIDDSISNRLTKPITDSTLQTGWYYIIETNNGYRRQVGESQVYYFIDPTPIVISKNFKTLTIYNNNEGTPEMMMTLDEKGTEAWSLATEKYIGKRLAFILDNKILEADYVNSQITGGITALIGGNYRKDELEKIKTVIEAEK